MKQLFSIRAATENDVDSLVELERESWTESMRHPFDQMMERIKTHIPKIFVLEMDGQVVGSICAQRIQDVESIRNTCWKNEDSLYDIHGQILQLLRVNTFLLSKPKITDGVAVGAILRDFCLAYAKHLNFKQVCAVTKTTDYHEDLAQDYASYVESRDERGQSPDSGLNFHVGKGAEVLAVLPSWRPEDRLNQGHGVLIAYTLEDSLVVRPISWMKKNAFPPISKFLVVPI